MTPRERWLAMIAAGALALVAAKYGYDFVSSEYSARYDQLGQLEQDLASRKALILRGQRSSRQMREWERRSLPPDPNLGRTLYHNWLVQLADQAKLSGVQISSTTPISRGDAYKKLTYSVHARGSLEQVTRFMYDFYRANHLHLVRSLTLTPEADQKGLDFLATVEALMVPTAEERATLGTEKSDRLAWSKWEDYQQPIVERNLFAPYTPPPPPPRETPVVKPTVKPPGPPPFDVAKFAYLTAILDVHGKPQAWLHVRTTGELLKLHAGDEFKVGEMHALVMSIERRGMQYSAAGKLHWLTLGKNLREAKQADN